MRAGRTHPFRRSTAITRATRVRTTTALAAAITATLLAGCSSGDGGTAVTSTVTVAPSASYDGNGAPITTAGGSSSSSGGSSSTSTPTKTNSTSGSSGGSTSSSPSTPSASSGSSAPMTPSSQAQPGTGSFANPQDGVALPDGYIPKKLKPGEKPPQFVVVSFDGVGWDEKWQYWFGISKKVPFRFTGFLSGTYMLTEATKTAYQPPFYAAGRSEINWNSATDLPTEINNLNNALATGNEIGTHFNGHFCASAGLPSGGDTWTTANWNQELDQFFLLIKNYKKNNPTLTLPTLKVTADDIKGERTPCLEGHEEDLFPALVKHNMEYDTSFTKEGLSWPKQSQQYKIWQIGMSRFPIHGTLPQEGNWPDGHQTQHKQVTMDFNFWISQRDGHTGTAAQSAQDTQQVVDTYDDMYKAAYNGNRAPLILGNHFNQWNNNAYSNAIGNFVLATCGKANTQCVPFRDLIAWMKVQDPSRLAQLQAQNPELGNSPEN